MSTVEKLQIELKEAMKAGDSPRLLLLRGLIAVIHNEEIKKRTSGKSDSLTEEEITQVFQREAKKRKEAAELFKTGGRPELAEKEEKEFLAIQAYLPQQLSREEVKATVEKIFAAGNTEFNTLIRETMKELKGKTDGQTVSEIIKEKLGS